MTVSIGAAVSLALAFLLTPAPPVAAETTPAVEPNLEATAPAAPAVREGSLGHHYFYQGRKYGSEQLVHPLRTIVNGGLSYQLNPKLSLILDVSNLFNEPVAFYRGIPDQMERTLITGTTINIGVSGRF